MRTALTLVRKHGSEKFETLAGPEVPIDKQIVEFKKLLGSRENATFAEAQLWYSDSGIGKKARFTTPAEKPKAEPKAKVEPKPKSDPKPKPADKPKAANKPKADAPKIIPATVPVAKKPETPNPPE